MITDTQIRSLCRSRDFLSYSKHEVNVVVKNFVLINFKTPNYLKNHHDLTTFKKMINAELKWQNTNRGYSFKLLSEKV